MNDSEIIKALECCSLSDCMADCIRLKCPFFIEKGFNRGCGLKDEYNGKRKLYKYALDLINRQQAEIDRLNIELKTMRGAANGFKAEVERLQKAECSFAEAGGKLVVQYKQAKDQICRLQADKDTLIRNYANCQKELLKEFAEQIKTAFYAEFDELIPSIMADKIDEIYKEMVGEKCNETD